jgi:hypothetical protein
MISQSTRTIGISGCGFWGIGSNILSRWKTIIALNLLLQKSKSTRRTRRELRDELDSLNGITQTVFNDNIFGFTAGGPVRKNKTTWCRSDQRINRKHDSGIHSCRFPESVPKLSMNWDIKGGALG